MDEQRKSGHTLVRAINVVLAVACFSFCCVYIASATSFGVNYLEAVQASSKLKSLPPPGSINLKPAEVPKFRVPLDDEAEQRLTAAVHGMPLASRAVEQGADDWDQASLAAKVSEVAAALRQGDLTDAQRDQLLRYLADTPFQPAVQPLVVEALRKVAADRERLNLEVLAAVVRTWAANEPTMRQLAAGPRSTSTPPRNVLTFFPNPITTRSPSADASEQIPREDQPLRDFSVSVLAGFQITSPQPAVEPQADSPADPSQPRSFEQTLAQLLDPNTANATIKELLLLNKNDPLRRQLSALSPEAVRQHGFEFNKIVAAADTQPSNHWYETLALGWRDQHMLDTLLELGPSPAAWSTDPDLLKRLARWAVAAGDPKWIGIVLERLPQREAPAMQDAPPRIFADNSWEAVVAESLSDLNAAEFGPLVDLIDKPTLAGAMARYVFTKRAYWPDNMIARVVQSAGEDDSRVSYQWVDIAQVDDDTRNRLTKAVAQLDAPKRRRAWEQLRSVTHAFQIEGVAAEVLGEKHGSGALWQELPTLLAMRDGAVLDVVAKVLAQRHEPSGFADAEQQRAVYRTIDARLAGRMLQGDTGTGDSFLKVADDYGGFATLRLLTVKLPELEQAGSDATWSPADVATTIERIRTRMLLEGNR